MQGYSISGLSILLPTLTRDLEISDVSKAWLENAVPVMLASFMLPSGRLADKFGGYRLYLAGLCIFATSSVIAGFRLNGHALILWRVLQGLGLALYLPSGLKLLFTAFRSGTKSKVAFAIYSATGCSGLYVGLLVAGLSRSQWRWYF